MRRNFNTILDANLRFIGILATALLIASVSNLSAQSSSFGDCGVTANTAPHSVEFIEVKYDFPSPGESTWFYEVNSRGARGLERVVFKLESDAHLMKGFPNNVGTYHLETGRLRPGKGRPEEKVQQGTGNRNIVFTSPLKKAGTRGYYITLDHNYAIGEIATTVVTKSKRRSDAICGPIPNGKIVCTDVCASPRLLQAEVVSDTSVIVSWDKLSCHKSYKLCGSNADGSFAGCRQVTGNSIHYKHLTPGETYHLYMRSNCKGIGSSEWSDTISFVATAGNIGQRFAKPREFETATTPVTRSGNTATEVNDLSSIRVFPNPARDFISVELAGLDSEWTLSNYNGTQYATGVTTADQRNLLIDAADFPTGVYLLQFNTSISNESIRVLVTPK